MRPAFVPLGSHEDVLVGGLTRTTGGGLTCVMHCRSLTVVTTRTGRRHRVRAYAALSCYCRKSIRASSQLGGVATTVGSQPGMLPSISAPVIQRAGCSPAVSGRTVAVAGAPPANGSAHVCLRFGSSVVWAVHLQQDEGKTSLGFSTAVPGFRWDRGFFQSAVGCSWILTRSGYAGSSGSRKTGIML